MAKHGKKRKMRYVHRWGPWTTCRCGSLIRLCSCSDCQFRNAYGRCANCSYK